MFVNVGIGVMHGISALLTLAQNIMRRFLNCGANFIAQRAGFLAYKKQSKWEE